MPSRGKSAVNHRIICFFGAHSRYPSSTDISSVKTKNSVTIFCMLDLSYLDPPHPFSPPWSPCTRYHVNIYFMMDIVDVTETILLFIDIFDIVDTISTMDTIDIHRHDLPILIDIHGHDRLSLISPIFICLLISIPFASIFIPIHPYSSISKCCIHRDIHPHSLIDIYRYSSKLTYITCHYPTPSGTAT